MKQLSFPFAKPLPYIHGNLVQVKGLGILLLGKPGTGKSYISWLLLQQGHFLIADDMVQLATNNSRCVIGKAASQLHGMLHSRKYGFCQIKKNFSAQQLLVQSEINFSIEFIEQPLEDMTKYPKEGWVLPYKYLHGIAINNYMVPVATNEVMLSSIDSIIRIEQKTCTY